MDLNAKPQPAAPTAPARTTTGTSPALLIGGVILALLILGGIAAAVMRRRNRVTEEEWTYDEPPAEERAEPTTTEEPVREPVMHDEIPGVVAPSASAFSFGPRETASEAEPMVEDERLPGETWIERAYRGPSPSNPSVSLKARLKRAAFFDKRERDAAAGRAAPLDPTAGLPEAMIEEQERESV